MRRVFAVLMAGLAVGASLCGADPARDARWRTDLQALATQFVRLHANAFATVPAQDFYAAVNDLDQRIPQLDDVEVQVGLMHIVALVGDAHSSIGVNFSSVPITLSWFNDGLFVTAVAPEYRQALGARVVRIGDMDTDAAAR